MQPETAGFAAHARMPFLHEIAGALGLTLAPSPLNASLLLALGACLVAHLLVSRSRFGYALRTLGANPSAAAYAGIPAARVTVIAMAVSGGLAGLMAVNEVMGVQHRLVLDFTAGYGFVGIAVALMGRAHPLGIVLASLLFGMLHQGGAELAFEKPAITRDMVLVIGGVVILFAGALDGLFRRPLAALLARGREA
jgi:simple sugar transport system permease protein